ncbi:MAG: chitobiase/beta-hexosaminidase C-terminal domain-containing protein, partial [Bacillota bacterium]
MTKDTSGKPLFLLLLWALSLMFVLNLPALAGGSSGFIDNLDDYSFTYQRSANMNRLDDLNYPFFDGDKSRLCRTTLDEGYVVYKTPYDMESFFIDMYYWPSAVMEDIKVYVASDGSDYREVALERTEFIGPWNRVVFEAYEMPVAHARFMKIVVTGKVEPWTPQIARVMVNSTVAPVAASPAPCKLMEPADVTLSTKTPGAEIHYSTNQDPAVRLYTGPIKLASSTKITAYAKKAGLIQSVTRTLAYTSAADEIVDRYGQLKKVGFPGKVQSDEELRADVAADKAYYQSLKPPKRDPYGGLLGSKKKYGLRATGFFHVEKLRDGRLVLVTPLGNAYFSLGVNGTGYYGDTYTKVAGREHVYEWLPPFDKYGTYATAYSDSGQDFSFYVANRIKKYGRPTLPKEFTRECVDRLKKWGFTSTGGWSDVDTCREIGFPNVRHLSVYDSIPEGRVSGIGFFDIFAEGVAQKIERKFADELPFYKDDPTLIGYFVDNELEHHRIKSVIPKTQASKVAAKKRLVEMLEEKYKGDIRLLNEAWESDFKSFAEMYEAELAIGTDAANDDLDAFIRLYLDTYYGTVAKLFRKYDPNHLLLGERWLVAPLKDDKLRSYLCEAAGKYFDVLSYNYYTYDLDLALLREMHVKSGGKPILLSEFLYAEPTQGLTRGVRVVANELEKGQAY